MSRQNRYLYEFGSFRLNAEEHLLTLRDRPVRVPPKAFELLLFFLRNNNQVIDKQILLREVWLDTFVEESNLTVHISTLRKIFAEDQENSVRIETFPKRGYRLTATVTEIIEETVNWSPSDVKHVSDDGSFTERRQAGVIALGEHGQPSRPNRRRDGSPSQLPSSFRENRNKMLVLFGVILIVLAGSAFYFFKFSNFPSSFEKMTISRIPDSAKSMEVAISPDGKYLAQSNGEGGKQSLWIKHLATNSNVELIAPDAVNYGPVIFSADESHIFYSTASGSDPGGSLYEIPLLGGIPRKILSGVSGSISFAPDADRFVFVRNVSPVETALMIADLSGEEHQLALRRKPEVFSAVGPAWSPDGKSVACAVGTTTGDRATKLFLFSVEDGTAREVSGQKWRNIDRLNWLSDRSGLIAPAVELDGQEAASIWFFPASGGNARRITNDLNDYGGMSVTADSKTIATIEFEVERNIWVAPNGDTSKAVLLTGELPDSYRFISWTPDNKILYTSTATGKRNISIMDADGKNRRQLARSSHNDVQPVVTPDGRYIVFSSNRNPSGAFNIWRMNMDGTNPVQLTNGPDENQPNPTIDSRWVLYVAGGMEGDRDNRRIWKVPIEGGDPIQLTDSPSYRQSVSPDGKQFACTFRKDKSSQWKIAVVPIGGGQPLILLDAPRNSPLRWAPDGNAITYFKTENGVSNVWTQPLDGSAPQQITNFTTEEILFFDWSKDNQLVCSRGVTNRNAILLKDLR